MVLAKWVFNKESASVPTNITIRLVSVKYLTSLKGLAFSSGFWKLAAKTVLFRILFALNLGQHQNFVSVEFADKIYSPFEIGHAGFR